MLVLLAEDALDRFLIEWFERRVGNSTARAVIRMLFNPSRSMANVAMNQGALVSQGPSRPRPLSSADRRV